MPSAVNVPAMAIDPKPAEIAAIRMAPPWNRVPGEQFSCARHTVFVRDARQGAPERRGALRPLRHTCLAWLNPSPGIRPLADLPAGLVTYAPVTLGCALAIALEHSVRAMAAKLLLFLVLGFLCWTT